MSFYLSVRDNTTLPSWKWTRTVNATHGQIVANVSVADGYPLPINATVYQARTVNGTKYIILLNIKFSLNTFLFYC